MASVVAVASSRPSFAAFFLCVCVRVLIVAFALAVSVLSLGCGVACFACCRWSNRVWLIDVFAVRSASGELPPRLLAIAQRTADTCFESLPAPPCVRVC